MTRRKEERMRLLVFGVGAWRTYRSSLHQRTVDYCNCVGERLDMAQRHDSPLPPRSKETKKSLQSVVMIRTLHPRLA